MLVCASNQLANFPLNVAIARPICQLCWAEQHIHGNKFYLLPNNGSNAIFDNFQGNVNIQYSPPVNGTFCHQFDPFPTWVGRIELEGTQDEDDDDDDDDDDDNDDVDDDDDGDDDDDDDNDNVDDDYDVDDSDGDDDDDDDGNDDVDDDYGVDCDDDDDGDDDDDDENDEIDDDYDVDYDHHPQSYCCLGREKTHWQADRSCSFFEIVLGIEQKQWSVWILFNMLQSVTEI